MGINLEDGGSQPVKLSVIILILIRVIRRAEQLAKGRNKERNEEIKKNVRRGRENEGHNLKEVIITQLAMGRHLT